MGAVRPNERTKEGGRGVRTEENNVEEGGGRANPYFAIRKTNASAGTG